MFRDSDGCDDDGCPYQLTASSPALNAGDNDVATEIATDFYGNARISGGTVDIGAIEFDVSTLYYAEFWNSEDLDNSPPFPEGEPDVTRYDEAIDFNWGSGAPADGINANSFFGRWTKTATFEAGQYIFSVRSDDGSRVYVDDELIIDNWFDQGGNETRKYIADISEGEHTIVVEFYEHSGGARISFSYIPLPFTGEGTEENPYVITSCEGLQAMDGFVDSHFELGDDVDCSETAEWNETNVDMSSIGWGNNDDLTYDIGVRYIVEDSVMLEYWDGDEWHTFDEEDYVVDYLNGTVTFDDPPGEFELYATFDYYQGFQPLGNTDQRFTGTLNGNGYVISNLVINRPFGDDSNTNYVGLFRVIDQGARVENLGIEDAYVRGYEFVGIVAGALSGTVDNVHTSGEVVGDQNVEGLVGAHIEPDGIGSSSPLVFTWNGEQYEYVADVGQTLPRDMSGVDYASIDSSKLVPKDGSYSVRVAQEYNEIVYYDEMALVTFDHAPGYDVASPIMRNARNKPERFVTVSDTPTHPLQSCVDMYGNDCFEDLVSYDDKWSYRDFSDVNEWIMNFGDLSGASTINLVLRGARDYTTPSDVPSVRTVSVKNALGEWVEIYNRTTMSGLDGTPRLRTLDLTDKFLSSDYSVKIGFDSIRLNYVAVDTSEQVPFTMTMYHPDSASLGFHGYTSIDKTYYWNHDYGAVSSSPGGVFAWQSGNFTKYGDVTPLLQSTNNQFVVMRHGDQISVEFPYVAPEEGLERSFMLYNNALYKHAKHGAWARTVDPLPYQ